MPRSNAICLLALPATSPAQHIALAVGKSGELALDFGASGVAPDIIAPALDCPLDACQQNFVIERLFQKIDGADFHRFDRQRHVALTGDGDYRHVSVSAGRCRSRRAYAHR